MRFLRLKVLFWSNCHKKLMLSKINMIKHPLLCVITFQIHLEVTKVLPIFLKSFVNVVPELYFKPNFYTVRSLLYPSNIIVNLLVQKMFQNIDEIGPYKEWWGIGGSLCYCNRGKSSLIILAHIRKRRLSRWYCW